MRTQTTATFILALAAISIAGCGGGYGSEKKPAPKTPQEATGELHAGRVSGVHYATATRSGETDAAGTFRYLPGEAVTFSIGGLVLGTAAGAAVITPFALAGTTPPTHELDLRRELDLATRIATPFSKAINIERLLIALDADNDPANGISVGDRAATLAGGDVDTGLALAGFAAQLRKRVPGLTGNLPSSQPLVFLYRALGISVPVHAEIRVDTTLPAVPDISPIVTTISYNAMGARATQRTDFDEDEHSDIESTWQYDALGRITLQSVQSIAVAGLPPPTVSVAKNYDTHGNLLGSDERHDGSAVGIPPVRLLRTLGNDDHGFALSDIVDTDNAADGVTDSRRSTNFRFDGRHNVTGITQEVDFGVDQVAEERTRVDASYDAGDRQLEITVKRDHDADGVIESTDHSSFEYEGAGSGVTRLVEAQDLDNDGVVDTRVVTTSTYDGAGFPLTMRSEFDSDGDGIPELVTRTTFVYDAGQRILTQQDLTDQDGDGIFEGLDRTTHVYDAVGNSLSVVSEFDIVEGVAGFTTRQTSRHGAAGERLELKVESRLGNAAEFTFINDSIFNHALIDDGVQTLAQQFLDDTGLVP